jgi:hypothetical protein
LADPFEDLLGPKLNAFSDLKMQEWNNIQSELMLVGTIPHSTLGEKCVHDLLMASIEKMGIFQYGRIEMFLFLYKDAAKVRVMTKAISMLEPYVAIVLTIRSCLILHIDSDW